ncbi:MAG: DNA replication/repair protein RecF [Calditrichaceae bacterium]|nr:DNA replication/repair protein RecF [Calditrichaceae bacterium]MBN2710444.1 DNA replication/repair protein RecF [Calditrichaceae bacterium]RQV93620.1 MAG: DNA replication/repair protein RecF [Calditrichota bacterium]
MHLKRLSLENFRNITKVSLDFNEDINLIHGKNGQGKTSILEAIYTLAITKSFRAKSENIILQNGKPHLEIKGNIISSNKDEFSMRFFYSEESGKNIFLNSNKINKYSEIIGMVPIVLLSLEDLELMFGMPAYRRKFMDILLSQVSPSYLVALQRYKRTLVQRNRLLTLINEKNEPKNSLEPWDAQLIQYAEEITSARFNLVLYLKERMETFYHFISNHEEKIDVHYRSSIIRDRQDVSADMIRTSYSEILMSKIDDDIRQKTTGYGPHRDDLLFLKDGYPMKSHGSQGENKTLLIALKFVEREYVRKRLNKQPIMLLDDVFSELDDNRVAHLVNHIHDEGQSFITTTNRDKFLDKNLPDMNFIQLDNGMVVN